MKRTKMKKKSDAPLPDQIRDKFDENLRPEINIVWEKSGLAQNYSDILSEDEIEDGLKRVNDEIDEAESHKTGSNNKIAGWIIRYSHIAVAAAAVIIAVSLFLLVPKTATVPYGELVMLELRDGSTIEANSGTTIRYSRLYPFLNRDIELNGEAFFSVQSHRNPFIVRTNGASVEVTGTEFNIRSWRDEPNGRISVTVTQGEVQFLPHQPNVVPVSITAGYESRWNPQLSKPTQPEPVATEDVLAWREMRFVFRELPLISIVQELERRYNTTIELDVPEAKQSTLTAYYSQPASIESILDDICTVKGLRYTQTTTGFRIFN
ncbi:MAG: FecR domain-containing protein [Balneolaceae bacterium]|nr:FecR domain-containing protein [Balneolaceae bacterium]